MINKQQLYWSNPKDKPNKPESYVKAELIKRSAFLYSLLSPLVNKTNSILEIGCNAGRNLNYLLGKGYLNLAGIEINENALKLMNKVYPKINSKNTEIFSSSIENTVPMIENKSVDVTFSLAVLMHLPYESNFIFKELARITKKYIIIIEDEKMELCSTHFPRDYKQIFERLRFKEIKNGKCPVKDLEGYTWRVFKKHNGKVRRTN